MRVRGRNDRKVSMQICREKYQSQPECNVGKEEEGEIKASKALGKLGSSQQ